jgi:hypothetical protein
LALAEAGLDEWAAALDREDRRSRGQIWWADLGPYRTLEQTVAVPLSSGRATL